jgi:acyl carrier protein
VLGTPGAGMDVAQDAMGFARLGIGALCVGAMKRCLQLMVRYAARRDIAGGRLLDNQVTLLRLHELECAIGAAESLVEALAAGIDAGGALPLEACSACKCVLSELLWEAVDRLMQMLGGRGYLETNLAPQLLRDARVLRILEGPSEALYAHLGALVRVPGNPVAQAIARFGGDAHALWPAQGSGAWQDARNGEFAAWTLLAATARGDAAAWAARRLDALRHAIGAESAAVAACPAGATLAARIAAHALAIGDIEQDAPGEAGGLDPLLRQAAPAAEVPEAPPPAAPSSLELVRTCFERWLCEGALGDAASPRIDAWTVDTPFGDLGIDSLASVPLALEIEGASGVPVSAELLYDYPTVRALAAYIDEQRDERRDAMRGGQLVERRVEFE